MPEHRSSPDATAPSGYLKGIGIVHSALVLRRRERVLARSIAGMLPGGLRSALDVGCGDGVIAREVARELPGLEIRGLEVHERSTCQIPCTPFDGRSIPFPDAAFDYVSLIDVLHHADDIDALLKESARVSKRFVVVKDHTFRHRLDHAVLRFMDWIGNRPHGVRLIYNYQTKDRWMEIFRRCGLRIVAWNARLGLYPFPASLVFEGEKHFLALLAKSE